MHKIGEIIKKIFNIVIGLIIWFAIIWYVMSFILEKAGKSESLSFWLVAIIFFFLVGAVVGTVHLISRYNERNPKCKHGIRNGAIDGLCEECAREKIIYEENEKKYKLQRKINDLRISELARLRQNHFQKLDYLYKLNPNEFEDVIMQLYRKLGYKVIQTPYTNDRGKDGVAYKDEKKFLIECKRYEKDKRIGRPMLQKFLAAMYEEQAEKGFFITTAQFAQTAIDYVNNLNDFNIELINGNELVQKMKNVYSIKGNSDTFIQYCMQCGNVVTFELLSFRKAKICARCGTENIANIINSDMTKTQKRTKKKYKRYYYK